MRISLRSVIICVSGQLAIRRHLISVFVAGASKRASLIAKRIAKWLTNQAAAAGKGRKPFQCARAINIYRRVARAKALIVQIQGELRLAFFIGRSFIHHLYFFEGLLLSAHIKLYLNFSFESVAHEYCYCRDWLCRPCIR